MNAQGGIGGRTIPLWFAAFANDNPAVIELLVRWGSELWGVTQAAAYNENPEVMRALVAAGADLSEALHSAVFNRNAAIAEVLIAAGADLDELHSEPGMPTRQGTPLHWAARNAGRSNTAVVELLLQAGADPNVLDEDGRTRSITRKRQATRRWPPYCDSTADGPAAECRGLEAGRPRGVPQRQYRAPRIRATGCYAGTEVELFLSLGEGGSWRRFMTGLPVGAHRRRVLAHLWNNELVPAGVGRKVPRAPRPGCLIGGVQLAGRRRSRTSRRVGSPWASIVYQWRPSPRDGTPCGSLR